LGLWGLNYQAWHSSECSGTPFWGCGGYDFIGVDAWKYIFPIIAIIIILAVGIMEFIDGKRAKSQNNQK
jgi:hypothetical protein